MAAISLRLPDDIAKRLESLAELTGRSKTSFMLEAIRAHLDDLEDSHVAEQRLAAHRAGESQAASLGDVMKRYGVEG